MVAYASSIAFARAGERDMTECEEVAVSIVKSYQAKCAQDDKIPTAIGLQKYVRDMLADESYNVMDQVEAAAHRTLWPGTWENNKLSYLRRATVAKDGEGSFIFLHSWPTGCQQLYFKTSEQARKWAEGERCTFTYKGNK